MASPQAEPKRRVVVIDDDDDFVLLVKMMLADQGLEIVTASLGQRGLELMRARRPDVVILDLMLPDMNGWEVYMQMQQEPTFSDIPVIILSVQGARPDRNFGLQVAQVHDYVVKPCLPSRLRRSVASALARR